MSLHSFVNDTTTREEVFDYILEKLDSYALDLVYAGEDAKGIKDAKKALLKAKSKMMLDFGEKPKSGRQNRAV